MLVTSTLGSEEGFFTPVRVPVQALGMAVPISTTHIHSGLHSLLTHSKFH